MNACLASILEIPEADVPDFLGTDQEWLAQLQQWLAPQGLYYVQIQPSEPTVKAAFAAGELYHTIEGLSPRGGMHACVGLNGRLVFDPHPQDGTGRGLVKVHCYGLLCARFA